MMIINKIKFKLNVNMLHLGLVKSKLSSSIYLY